MQRFTRRAVLGSSLGLAASVMLAGRGLAAAPKTGASKPFSFTSLIAQAKTLAASEYEPALPPKSPWLAGLGYDDYRDIHHNPSRRVWQKEGLPFRMEFFHLGALYMAPVAIHEVSQGRATPVAYDPSLFSFGKLQPPEEGLPQDLGYAGLRFHFPLNKPDVFDELAVFLGASYFRSLGKGQYYGLSARGLAVDTALAKGEEFPVFSAFWVERPARGSRKLTIYALLESKSITGAYRFIITPGTHVMMDITASLFPRAEIERLGLAPLTSMYAHGENDQRLPGDFRPEVHDSDGLLVASSAGEWLWRPLRNPATLSVSSLQFKNPRGFGLLQRDREFGNYQDLEAHYEQRPSLWVEPKGEWGEGSVQLVEIPTDSEIHDNIVAYWVPKAPVVAGQRLDVAYRLIWGNAPDSKGRPAEVLATHVGRQFERETFKFVVDFSRLSGLRPGVMPEVDLWFSGGKMVAKTVVPNQHNKGWRVAFDWRPEGNEPVEMRCALRSRGKQLTETWSYQWSA